MRLNPEASSQPRVRVAAIVPARNEQETIANVVRDLLQLRRDDQSPWIDEVIVANNGSTDATASQAGDAGAIVINVPRPGYGEACWSATRHAHAQTLLFFDGDGAADAIDCPALLAAIEAGSDMAIGVRTQPDAGSMSMSQMFGNGFACALIRMLWRAPISDLGPHRAIRATAFDRIDMQDRGFGWTVEMQVRAHVLGLRVREIPVAWRVRAGGVSKISGTWRGVFGAGVGILGMVYQLWRRERRRADLQLKPLASRESL